MSKASVSSCSPCCMVNANISLASGSQHQIVLVCSLENLISGPRIQTIQSRLQMSPKFPLFRGYSPTLFHQQNSPLTLGAKGIYKTNNLIISANGANSRASFSSSVISFQAGNPVPQCDRAPGVGRSGNLACSLSSSTMEVEGGFSGK